MTIEEQCRETISWFEDERKRLSDTSYNKALLLVAIEALRKQIPMKPHRPNELAGTCKVCHITHLQYHKYCYECGQRLDWRDEE